MTSHRSDSCFRHGESDPLHRSMIHTTVEGRDSWFRHGESDPWHRSTVEGSDFCFRRDGNDASDHLHHNVQGSESYFRHGQSDPLHHSMIHTMVHLVWCLLELLLALNGCQRLSGREGSAPSGGCTRYLSAATRRPSATQAMSQDVDTQGMPRFCATRNLAPTGLWMTRCVTEGHCCLVTTSRHLQRRHYVA